MRMHWLNQSYETFSVTSGCAFKQVNVMFHFTWQVKFNFIIPSALSDMNAEAIKCNRALFLLSYLLNIKNIISPASVSKKKLNSVKPLQMNDKSLVDWVE